MPVREHPKVSPDDELRLTGKCHSAIRSWKDCLISNGQNLSNGKTFQGNNFYFALLTLIGHITPLITIKNKKEI